MPTHILGPYLYPRRHGGKGDTWAGESRDGGDQEAPELGAQSGDDRRESHAGLSAPGRKIARETHPPRRRNLPVAGDHSRGRLSLCTIYEILLYTGNAEVRWQACGGPNSTSSAHLDHPSSSVKERLCA